MKIIFTGNLSLIHIKKRFVSQGIIIYLICKNQYQ